MLFLRIRGKTIKYATYCKRQDNELENRLKSEIQALENNSTDSPTSLKADSKKVELEMVRQKAITGSTIRARAQWINEGGKPTRYFCSLEKYNYVEKMIKCIQIDNGKTLTDQKAILNEIANFYSALFTQKNHYPSDQNLDKLFEGKKVNKLTFDESSKLEGKLSLH